MLFQLAYHIGHRRRFLSDGDVNAFYAGAFLIDDRINRNRCFPGLSVADDQFALTATNWNHGID